MKLGCSTEEEKDAYIADYEINQGIKLEKDKIGDYNSGLYRLAKLNLNTLWGKFGQRAEYTQSIDTFDRETFVKYAHNEKYNVKSVFMHDNRARTIKYTVASFELNSSYAGNRNIAIAAFVTAHARLRLYEAL